MLRVHNLSVQFALPHKTVYAVNGIDLAVPEGKVTALIGESGCGKSVSALAAMGLLDGEESRVSWDRIVFDGKDVDDTHRPAYGKDISLIYQDPYSALNPRLKCGYQVMEPLLIHGICDRRAARKRALEVLGDVGFSDPGRVYNMYPSELSGGMKQRVLIASAIITRPKLLIADEPTTALDVTIQAQILDLIKRLQREHRLSMLLITHDMGIVADIADEIVIMYLGRVLERGAKESIYRNPGHPYTRGLLRCIPRKQNKDRALFTIKGHVEQLMSAPAGCVFAPRCELCRESCRQTHPALVSINEHHGVYCPLTEGGPHG